MKEDLTILVLKTRALISCTVTTQLICAFAFTYMQRLSSIKTTVFQNKSLTFLLKSQMWFYYYHYFFIFHSVAQNTKNTSLIIKPHTLYWQDEFTTTQCPCFDFILSAVLVAGILLISDVLGNTMECNPNVHISS